MFRIGLGLGLNRGFGSAADAYAVLGYKPELVFDFAEDYYRANSAATTFSDALTHSATTNGTMVDSDGLLKWRPHNLLTYSEQFDNWATLNFGSGALPVVTDNGDYFTVTLDRVGDTISDQSQIVSNTISGVAAGTELTALVRIRASTPDDVGKEVGIRHAGIAAYGIITLTSEWQDFERIEVSPSGANFNTTIANRGTVTADTSVTFDFQFASLYRSDLGGMVNNPDRGDSYVPTTSTARYLPRRGHHIWNGTSWVNEGLLHESEARTNLLHTTNALVTQSLTVTAVPHTLHFTGTGTVTLLSGASTAGPLVGTGTGENNRVSLTFTPTAASLTLTVTGTVTNAQLEVGSTPSSYIPNLAASGSVTRAADTLTVPAAKLPYSATAMSIQMQGRMTRNNDESISDPQFILWRASSGNEIYARCRDDSVYEGEVQFGQASSVVFDSVISAATYPAGVNVPFNIASRHGSTFINGAVDGTALTADLTPTALPDLSATDLNLAYAGGPMVIKSVRMWAADITDAGLEAATV